MMLTIDPSSPLPLYYQIREQLRGQILSGALRPGDALPGEIEICRLTGVSRMTARQALSQLANEGLITRQRGRGTFVAEPKRILPGVQEMGLSYTEILGQAGISAGARILKQDVLPAGQELAGRLKLQPGDPVVRIVRTRSAAGEIMSLETSYFSQARFPDLAQADLKDISISRFLEQRYGLVLDHAADMLEISVADRPEAEMLGISEGGPIALVTTSAFLEDDTPIVFTQTVHRGDRFRSIMRRSRQQLG